LTAVPTRCLYSALAISFRLASHAIAIGIEAVVVDPDDGDFPGVVRTITAAAFTVVIGGIGIEAGPRVIGVAFRGFFFDFGFFNGFGFTSRGFGDSLPFLRSLLPSSK
jgi:hypothetical protein